jgi:hypothetical protein
MTRLPVASLDLGRIAKAKPYQSMRSHPSVLNRIQPFKHWTRQRRANVAHPIAFKSVPPLVIFGHPAAIRVRASVAPTPLPLSLSLNKTHELGISALCSRYVMSARQGSERSDGNAVVMLIEWVYRKPCLANRVAGILVSAWINRSPLVGRAGRYFVRRLHLSKFAPAGVLSTLLRA